MGAVGATAVAAPAPRAAESPARPTPLGGLLAWPLLAAIEGARLLRSWKLRLAVAGTLGAAYLLGRTEGFGAAAPAPFPGGERGIAAFALLVAACGAYFAVDAAGAADRRAARALYEARPASPLLLQTSRWAALFVLLLPLPAIGLAWPYFSVFGGAAIPAWEPVRMLAAYGFAPLLGASIAAGLLARAAASRDGGALLAAGLLAAPPVAYAIAWMDLADINTSTTPLLGVLAPRELYAADAAALWSYAGLLLALACLRPWRVAPKTPLRSIDPPRPSRFPSLRRTMAALALLPRSLGPAGLAAAVAAAALAPGTTRLAEPLIQAREAVATAPREPEGAIDGRVPPLGIRHREIDLATCWPSRLRVVLTAHADDAAPLAGVGFGPHLRARLAEGTPRARLIPDAAVRSEGALVLAFDPPLEPGEEIRLAFDIEPTRSGERLLAWARHPVFGSWARLGAWHGEGLEIDYREGVVRAPGTPSPYSISAPAQPGRQWTSGGAAVEDAGGGIMRIVQPRPDTPALLSLSRQVEVADRASGLDIRLLVFPEHQDLAAALHTAWRQRWSRVARLFGPGEEAIVFQETPLAESPTPLAIPTATMAVLDAALPRYDDWRDPSAHLFDRTFRDRHRAAIERIVQSRAAPTPRTAPLLEALVDYADARALAGGQTRGFLRTRVDWTIVPWEWANQRQEIPFLVRERDQPRWIGSAWAADRAPGALAPAPERFEAFHHLLRYLLGDREWASMVRELFEGRDGRPIPLEEWRDAAQRRTDFDMAALFREWLDEGVLPSYRIVEVESTQQRTASTGDILYRTRSIVANAGTGTLPVEVVLTLDRDKLSQRVVLPPGERREVVFESLQRPLYLEVDPFGWIPQGLPFDESRGRFLDNRVVIRAVRTIEAE